MGRRIGLSYFCLTSVRTMPIFDRATTTVSTKGQVILPKAIREHRRWEAGTRLIVEETPDGVLLRAAPSFPETRPDEVFASLPHSGAPKTLAEMDAGIAAEAKRRHARHRY
jgi:AbrB family looped-hinge helix DNA binding protein